MTNTTTRTATVPAQPSTGSRVCHVFATWPADSIRHDVLRGFLPAGRVKHYPRAQDARELTRGGLSPATLAMSCSPRRRRSSSRWSASAASFATARWLRIVGRGELRWRAALLSVAFREELDRRIEYMFTAPEPQP